MYKRILSRATFSTLSSWNRRRRNYRRKKCTNLLAGEAAWTTTTFHRPSATRSKGIFEWPERNRWTPTRWTDSNGWTTTEIWGTSRRRGRRTASARTMAITRAARPRTTGPWITERCPRRRIRRKICRTLTRPPRHRVETRARGAASTLALARKSHWPPNTIINPSSPISSMVPTRTRTNRIRHPVHRHLRHRPPIPQVAQRCRRASPRAAWCITAADWSPRRYGGPGARAPRGRPINPPSGRRRWDFLFFYFKTISFLPSFRAFREIVVELVNLKFFSTIKEDRCKRTSRRCEW